jgi:hypothetical protein
MKMVRQKCDPKMVKEFGDSRLSADFAKPAQPALVNAGVQSVRDVARKTAGEIAGLHGLGPSRCPPLRAALKKHRLQFRPATRDD